jgi:hypothetical protein
MQHNLGTINGRNMADSNSGISGVIGAVVGILSLFVALLSANAARRSASAASTAAEHARNTEYRALLREIISAAQGVLGEVQRLESTAARLVNGYQTLFALSGRSSRESVYINNIESKKNELSIEVMKSEASRIIENPYSLRTASAEDIGLGLAKIEGNRIRLQTLRQEFDAELTSVEEQIRPLRENALSRSGFNHR